MSKQRFSSVWDTIEGTSAEAENMITRTEMSQAQAAQLFGVTQPRISA